MVKYYHPDKNRDYTNAKYVVSKVQEAYQTITGVDDSERNNLEK
jgi:DnaJ-class molecular chaperone